MTARQLAHRIAIVGTVALVIAVVTGLVPLWLAFALSAAISLVDRDYFGATIFLALAWVVSP